MIERFEALAASAGLAPAQLALAWVLAQGDHLHAIPGTTSVAHMRENIAAASIEVAPTVLENAGALINQLSVAGHRYPDAMLATIDTEEFS